MTSSFARGWRGAAGRAGWRWVTAAMQSLRVSGRVGSGVLVSGQGVCIFRGPWDVPSVVLWPCHMPGGQRVTAVPGVGSVPMPTALCSAAVTQRRGFCSPLNAPSTTCEALPPAWQGKGCRHWHGGMVGTCPQLGGTARGGEGTAGGSAVSSGMLGRGPGESHLAAKLGGRKWSGGILVSPAASCQLARCTWVANWRGFVSGVGIVHAPRPQALLLAIGNCWRGSGARAAGERGQPVGSQCPGVALPRSSSSSFSSPGSFSGSKQEQTGDASPRRAPRAGECWRAGAVEKLSFQEPGNFSLPALSP